MLPLISLGAVLLSLLYVIVSFFGLYPTAAIADQMRSAPWLYGAPAMDLAGVGIAVWLLFNSSQNSYVLGGKRFLLFIIVCGALLALLQGYWLALPYIQTSP